MATYKPTYASTSDLRDIYPNIDKFDAKTQVLGWNTGLTDFQQTLDIYYTANCGLINQLFWDGVKVDKITYNTTETTKVDGAFTASATVFYVDASHGLEANDIVKIDEEYIRVVSVSSDTITISTPTTNRGLFGSSAQHHANDVSVYKIIDTSIDVGDASSAGVDALGYVYDSDLDLAIIITNSLSPINYLVEAGENWKDHQNDILYKASRYFDSYVDPTLPTQMWKNDEGEYDYIVIRTTAQICAYFLLSAHDPENEDALKIKEEYEGVLDRINEGGIKLGFEKSADSSQGIITELSANASSTLKPVDLRGRYRGSVYDKIRLQVITGGLIGTATYSVWVNGNDKLGINKGSQVVTAEKITGSYQTLSGGLQIRFGGSTPTGVSGATADLLSNVATASDVYQIEVWAVGEEMDDARGIKSAYMTRS